MCVGAAMATSAFTRSAEQAQFTSLPLLGLILTVGIWVVATGIEDDGWIKRIAPGGAIAELIGGAWNGMAWSDAGAGLAALADWAGVGAAIGLRFFRWEPRH